MHAILGQKLCSSEPADLSCSCINGTRSASRPPSSSKQNYV